MTHPRRSACGSPGSTETAQTARARRLYDTDDPEFMAVQGTILTDPRPSPTWARFPPTKSRAAPRSLFESYAREHP